MDINVEYLHKLFEYCDGKLIRRIYMCGRATSGSEAGNLTAKGYLEVKIKDRTYKVHRIIWAMRHGTWPSGQIDHVNGNKSDNRIENLREVTQNQNMWNRGRLCNNKTGYKGVSKVRSSGRYKAQIKHFGRVICIGTFETPEEAYVAYCDSARRLHGEYAKTQ